MVPLLGIHTVHQNSQTPSKSRRYLSTQTTTAQQTTSALRLFHQLPSTSSTTKPATTKDQQSQCQRWHKITRNVFRQTQITWSQAMLWCIPTMSADRNASIPRKDAESFSIRRQEMKKVHATCTKRSAQAGQTTATQSTMNSNTLIQATATLQRSQIQKHSLQVVAA